MTDPTEEPGGIASGAPRSSATDAAPDWGLGYWLLSFAGAFLAAVLVQSIVRGSAPADVVPPRQVVAGNIALPLCFVAATLYALLRREVRRPEDVLQAHGANGRDVAIGAALGLVLQLVISVFYATFRISVHQRVATDLTKLVGPQRVALVVVAALAAPVGEELFFRVLLLDALRRRFPLAWAVVAQGIAFGLVHIDSRAALTAVPALAFAGMAFGYLYARGVSVFGCIAAHMAFNSLAVAGLLG
jgi:membrane protease YdiL (CAAX protease family)